MQDIEYVVSKRVSSVARFCDEPADDVAVALETSYRQFDFG